MPDDPVPAEHAHRLPLWSAAAVAITVLVAYCAMTPPVPGDGDCGEFTIVLARAALAHPTGYPLFTLLGHGFCVVAHAAGASWALAAGLWSAVGGAFAAFFLFRLADRLIGDQPVLGRAARFAIVTTPTVLFTLNPMVTFETTHAEVYSWHLAWVCGASLLFVYIMTEVLGGEEDPGPKQTAIAAGWWGFVAGIGLAHHTTAALVAGPMTIAILWRLLFAWPRRALSAAVGLVTLLIGLASHGFVFWKIGHPDHADWMHFERTLQGAIDHINAKQYKEWVIGDFKPSEVQKDFLASWIYPWLFPGLSLLAVAPILSGTCKTDRRVRWTLLAAAIADVGFTFRLRVDDPSSYFLAALALGLVALAPVTAWIAAKAPRYASIGAGALLLTALLVGGSWMKTGLGRRSVMIEADSLIRGMWLSIPPGPGIVFWENDMFHRLRAFQILDGEKPELEIWESDGLQSPILREGFRQRLGFDPLEGLTDITSGPVTVQESRQALHRNVNRKTALPVYEFEPENRAVRLLKKPARTGESR